MSDKKLFRANAYGDEMSAEKLIEEAAKDNCCEIVDFVGDEKAEAYFEGRMEGFKQGAKWALEYVKREQKKKLEDIDECLACTACGAHIDDGIFGNKELKT
jgi:hypothetical protein